MSLPITSSTAPVVEEYDLEVRGSESTFVGLKEASPSHGQIDVGEAQEPGTKHHPKYVLDTLLEMFNPRMGPFSQNLSGHGPSDGSGLL